MLTGGIYIEWVWMCVRGACSVFGTSRELIYIEGINLEVVVMEEKKKPLGRPRKFESPEHMEELCMEYINDCIEKQEPILITGMAIALGTNRETINEYGRGTYDTTTESYSATLKRIKAYAENDAAKRLYSNHTIGSIFNLKNNFNWADRQEIDMTANVSISMEKALEDMD